MTSEENVHDANVNINSFLHWPLRVHARISLWFITTPMHKNMYESCIIKHGADTVQQSLHLEVFIELWREIWDTMEGCF